MVISSRTPEGQPNRCPVCGSHERVEPSDPAREAPCPRCGHLLWFARQEIGQIHVIKPTVSRLVSESLDQLIESLEIRSHMRLVIDFSAVQYVAGPVRGKLINVRKKLGAVGGRLGLRNMHPYLMEIFWVTRLGRVFDLDR